MSKPKPDLWKKSPKCWMLSSTPPPPIYPGNLTGPAWIDPLTGATNSISLEQGSPILSTNSPTTLTSPLFYGEQGAHCANLGDDCAVYVDAGHLRNYTTPDNGRVQARFQFTTFCPNKSAIITVVLAGGITFSLGIDPSKHLQLYTGGNGPSHYVDTPLGSPGLATLATATLYRICVSYQITDTTTWQLTWWLNDDTANPETIQTPDGATNTGTLATNSVHDLVAVGSTSAVFFAGDQVVDVSHLLIDSELTAIDMGDVRTTVKQSVTDVMTGFTFGFGGASGVHHTTYAARPLDTVAGWQTPSPGVNIETTALQDMATGDVDLTGATILGAMWFAITESDIQSNAAFLQWGSSLQTIIIGTGFTVNTHTEAQSSWASVDQVAGVWSDPLAGTTNTYTLGAIVAYTP